MNNLKRVYLLLDDLISVVERNDEATAIDMISYISNNFNNIIEKKN